MAQEKDEYEYQAHRFVFRRSVGKHVCLSCGLVQTNTPFATWATEKGCNNELHPSFKGARMKYTRMFK